MIKTFVVLSTCFNVLSFLLISCYCENATTLQSTTGNLTPGSVPADSTTHPDTTTLQPTSGNLMSESVPAESTTYSDAATSQPTSASRMSESVPADSNTLSATTATVSVTTDEVTSAHPTASGKNCTLSEIPKGLNTNCLGITVDVGETCSTNCSQGYYLSNTTSPECIGQDAWNVEWDDICSADNCTVPTDIKGGVTDCEDVVVDVNGTACNIACSEGHFLNSSSPLTCVSQDVWSGSWEVCQNITCIGLPELAGGGVNGTCTGNSYNDTCSLMCYVGYSISGTEEAMCKDNNTVSNSNSVGHWDIGDTTCTIETCTVPTVKNGTSDCASVNIVNAGEMCEITCNEGYYPTSETSLNCTSEDIWNNTWDVCSKITCSPAPILNNGEVDEFCTGDMYGDTCPLMCYIGYYINGTEVATCKDMNASTDSMSDGYWDMGGTACTIENCTVPTIDGGINDCGAPQSIVDAGMMCKITCNEGYHVLSEISPNCTSQDNWNQTWDVCSRISCSGLPDLSNGDVNGTCTGERYNDTCQLMCHIGYSISGAAIATCEDNSVSDSNSEGIWDIGDTKCSVDTCLSQASNGGESDCLDIVDAGTICNITCYEGYYLNSEISPNCTSQDTWSGNWNACSIENCTVPIVTGGTSNCGDPMDVVDAGQMCEITCKEGYFITFNASSNCTEQDTWSPDWDVCSKIKCDDLPELNHGGAVGGSCSTSSFDKTCQLNCDVGYFITGNQSAKCIDNEPSTDGNSIGVWDVGDAKCSAYMVVSPESNNTEYSAVKYRDLKMTIDVESEPKSNEFSISVFLTKSPRFGNETQNLTNATYSDGVLKFEITIYNVTEDDEGSYRFESSSSSKNVAVYPNINETVFQSVVVEVIPEHFTLAPPPTSGKNYTYVREDTSFDTITCVANGVPDPTITWEATTGNGTGHITSNKEILELKNAYFSDYGEFRCNGTNNVSEVYGEYPSETIDIIIEGSPVGTSEDQMLLPRDNITLMCSMDASPKPTVTWWRNMGLVYTQSTDVFVEQSDITNASDAIYFTYENSLSLTSQLCMGPQNVTCQTNNTIGEGSNPTIFTINTGAYDLFGESYLTFPTEEVNFSQAQKKCADSEGHLVYIQSEDTQEYLNNNTNILGPFWIGAVRDNTGVWTWGENGPRVDETDKNWIEQDGGNCAISNATGWWQAVDCNDTYTYVCELEASGIPKNLDTKVDECDGTYLKVTWEAADTNFATTEHHLIITNHNKSDELWEERTGTRMEFSYEFHNANPNIQYKIEVYAGVDTCVMFFPSSSKLVTTGFDTPEEVTEANMKSNEDPEEPRCTLNWEYDPDLKWQIDEYKVTVKVELLENTDENAGDPPGCEAGLETSCSFVMSANSQYSATVIAHSCAGDGTPVNVVGTCTAPVAAPENKLELSNKTQTPGGSFDASAGINVVIPAQDQRNGPISCIFVVVSEDGSNEESNARKTDVTMENFIQVSNGQKNGQYFAYVTDQVTVETEFTIGNSEQRSSCTPGSLTSGARKRRSTGDDTYNAYNADLDSSKYYRYYLLSTTPTTGADGNTTFLIQSSEISGIYVTNPYLAWIAGVVVPIFCILVAIGAYVYYRRKKAKNDYDRRSAGNELHPTFGMELIDEPLYDEPIDTPSVRPRPIPEQNLENMFSRNHKDDDRLFRDEYKEIKDQARRIEFRFAEAKDMRALNRFVNVLPASDARVHLSIQGNQQNSDYINASYIDGYQQPQKFIATQGPKPNTINDFWRMIWEKNVVAIVMLTNVEENGRRKCEKYWPEKSTTSSHGNLSVAGVDENYFGPIVRRTFRLSEARGHGKTTNVIQYHYVAWPDHGVPFTTSDLFNLRRLVRVEFGKTDLPIVVHCSAGVGRTGTFIALDYLMEELNKKHSVDVKMQVWRMRMNRTEMVQTADQYVLLHKMLLEAYLFGDTDMAAAIAEQQIKQIGEIGDQKLRKELSLIARVPPMDEDKDLGNSSEHKSKNRNPDAVPYDHNFAAVRMRPDEREAPYLNASIIQGYDIEDKFIVMQDPLPGNEEFFWRMVLDNQAKCIVMIRKNGDSQDMSAKYWPDDQHSAQFGSISVSLLDTFPEKTLIQRNLFVKETVLTSNRSSTVHQFEFIDWPESPNEDVASIIDLITRVQRQKQRVDAGTGPVLVHCGDGSEKTGTYCAITHLLERLKLENRVDIVRTVKDLRDMRPRMVTDLHEYRLCHFAIPEYLNMFEEYANFR